MILSREEEGALVEQAREGDEAAWRRLCESGIHSLYRFFYYRVGQSSQDAEDLLQDTLLTAVERLSSYRGDGSWYAWMLGIARHKLQHFYRDRKTQQATAVALDRLDDELGDWIQETAAMPHVRAAMEQRQIPHLMAAALSALPPRTQDLLMKKYAEGHTIEELAADLGEHPKAVASALDRAKKIFQYAFIQLSQSEVFHEA